MWQKTREAYETCPLWHHKGCQKTLRQESFTWKVRKDDVTDGCDSVCSSGFWLADAWTYIAHRRSPPSRLPRRKKKSFLKLRPKRFFSLCLTKKKCYKSAQSSGIFLRIQRHRDKIKEFEKFVAKLFFFFPCGDSQSRRGRETASLRFSLLFFCLTLFLSPVFCLVLFLFFFVFVPWNFQKFWHKSTATAKNMDAVTEKTRNNKKNPTTNTHTHWQNN